MDLLTLFFTLLIGHAVADFVLQPGPMARGKNRHIDLRPEFGPQFPPWYYWLSAHSLTHAGFVLLITGSMLYAVLETISHALIDFGKCERKYNFHVDQLLHMLVKVAYCILFHLGIA